MKKSTNLNDFEDMFGEDSTDALYYMEIPSGTYTYFTQSAKAIFGYSQEEFYDNPLFIKQLIHPNYKEYFKEAWTKLLSGDIPEYYEYEIIDKDNNTKHLNQRNHVVRDDAGKIIAIKGIITDVTHHKSVLRELEESRKKFDEIAQTTSDWMWEVDKNGIYVHVSDRVEDFLGYTAQEMIGKSPFDTMPQEEAQTISKKFLQYLAEYKPFKNLENINIHKNGNYVLLETSAFPIYDENNLFMGYRGTDRDISETKNLINNLKEAQKLSKIGHWEYDVVTDELYWSDEMYRIFGLEAQEFKPTHESFLTYTHPDDRELVKSTYIKSLEEKSSYTIKHKVLTKDNKRKYVEKSCLPKFNSNGDLIKFIGTIHDITKQVEDEKDLNIAANVYKHSNDGIIITDKNNLIVSINQAFENLTGYSSEEVKGKNPRLFSSGWGDKDFYAKMWSDLNENDFWQEDIWDRKKDGTVYASNMSIICIRNAQHNPVNYIAISHDITESKNKEKAIYELAYYDFLTKLPNRKLFKQEVESYIKSSHYNRKKFAILFLDLDNFKWVNDSLGHHVGDKVLIKVSKLLSSLLPRDSIVSRLGGDEFIIIAPYRDKLSISRLATNILKTVADPIIIDDKEINVGWSIGISTYPTNATSYSDLLKTADTAMYMAKENGKNNFRYFNNQMNLEAVERLSLDIKLRNAIKNNSFTLSYQPKFSLKENKIKGVEALIRWHDYELGNVSPDKFIPIAEEAGYIKEIGDWVMQQAITDLKTIHSHGYSEMIMAINISGKQLDEEDFYEKTKQLILESGVNPKFIEFEITETSIMKNIDSVITTLEKIKELGISISIDDFGTGYSSLSYINKLPADVLKIDRAFVTLLESKNDSSNTIVEATIALSKALKLKTVAEGVETLEQKEILTTLGCDLIQGYLYSKPLELNSLVHFMQE